jgi:hypothetical protein
VVVYVAILGTKISRIEREVSALVAEEDDG